MISAEASFALAVLLRDFLRTDTRRELRLPVVLLLPLVFPLVALPPVLRLLVEMVPLVLFPLAVLPLVLWLLLELVPLEVFPLAVLPLAVLPVELKEGTEQDRFMPLLLRLGVDEDFLSGESVCPVLLPVLLSVSSSAGARTSLSVYLLRADTLLLLRLAAALPLKKSESLKGYLFRVLSISMSFSRTRIQQCSL